MSGEVRMRVPLDWFLVASAVLVVGLALFHSLLGERYIIRRLMRRQDLPRLFGDDSFTRLTIRYAWHLLTLVFLAVGALLMVAAARDEAADGWAVWIIAVMLEVCGLWGVVSTRGRHFSWIVLIVAGALAAASRF